MNTTQTTHPHGDFGPVQARDLMHRLGYAETLVRMVGNCSKVITSYRDDDSHPVETRTHGRDATRFHALVRIARGHLDEVALLVVDSVSGPNIDPYPVLRVVEALELSTHYEFEESITHHDVRNAADIACAMLAELRSDCEREGMFRLASDGADSEELQPAPAH